MVVEKVSVYEYKCKIVKVIDGDDLVHVGRIRKDLWSDKRINLWVVADNLLKGAALNSVQIAELIFD